MVAAVGVFVDWPASLVAALAQALRLDAAQLHGAESPEEVRALSKTFRTIKAFAVRPGFRAATLGRYGAASAFLLDGFSDGLELERTQTVMQGASHCDFRFKVKAAPQDAGRKP